LFHQDGQQYGDEYLAELDYIEVVERCKEGYESDVDALKDESYKSEPSENMTESEDEPNVDSDRWVIIQNFAI
jgi:histone-lysine N-methyltransferase SETDB1